MKKVAIVGVGALGSHVVQFLRNHAEFRIIDFDHIEQKNILSQFHGKPNIGKAKVSALQQVMSFLFSVKLSINGNKLTKDNAKQLLGDVDLIIDCLDNPEARILVQEFSKQSKIPCLHGALAANGAFGVAGWDDKFTISEGDAGVPTCENGEQLPFIALVSTYIARSAQDFLSTGKKFGYMISPQNATRV